MKSVCRIVPGVLLIALTALVSGCFASSKLSPDKLAEAAATTGAEEYDYDEYVSMQNGFFGGEGDANAFLATLGNGIFCRAGKDDIVNILKDAKGTSSDALEKLIDQYNQTSDMKWNPDDVVFEDYDSITGMTSYSLINYSVSTMSYCYITSFEFDFKASADNYYSFQAEHADDADELLAGKDWGIKTDKDEGTKSGIDYFLYQMHMTPETGIGMKSYALILRDGNCVATCLIIDMSGKKGYKMTNKILEEMGVFTLDDIK